MFAMIPDKTSQQFAEFPGSLDKFHNAHPESTHAKGTYHGPVVSQFRKLLDKYGGNSHGLNFAVPHQNKEALAKEAKKAGHNFSIGSQHSELSQHAEKHKQLVVKNHGGAGYVVQHKGSGRYLAFFKDKGKHYWAESDDNAAVHGSHEEAMKAGKAGLKHHDEQMDQYSELSQPIINCAPAIAAAPGPVVQFSEGRGYTGKSPAEVARGLHRPSGRHLEKHGFEHMRHEYDTGNDIYHKPGYHLQVHRDTGRYLLWSNKKSHPIDRGDSHEELMASPFLKHDSQHAEQFAGRDSDGSDENPDHIIKYYAKDRHSDFHNAVVKHGGRASKSEANTWWVPRGKAADFHKEAKSQKFELGKHYTAGRTYQGHGD